MDRWVQTSIFRGLLDTSALITCSRRLTYPKKGLCLFPTGFMKAPSGNDRRSYSLRSIPRDGSSSRSVILSAPYSSCTKVISYLFLVELLRPEGYLPSSVYFPSLYNAEAYSIIPRTRRLSHTSPGGVIDI